MDTRAVNTKVAFLAIDGSRAAPMIYRFGDYELDTQLFELRSAAENRARIAWSARRAHPTIALAGPRLTSVAG